MSWGWRLIFCLRLGYALGLRQLRGWYMWDFRLKSGITDHKSSAREPNESSMGRRERRIFQYFSWENHLEMVGFSVHGSWWVFWGGSPRRSTCTRPSLEWRSTSLMVATCCDCWWCLEWPGMKVEGKMMEDDRSLCCLIFRALWREWFFDSQTLLMECWSRKIRALRFSDQSSSGWKTPVGWELVPGLWYCCGGT